MMGGRLAHNIFDGLMGQGLSQQDMQSYAQQLSAEQNRQRQMNALQVSGMSQAQVGQLFGMAPPTQSVVNTGPGLLPKDLIPMLDFEYADNIPARIAQSVEKLIESRKPQPAQSQQRWGQQVMQSWATSMISPSPFIRGF